MLYKEWKLFYEKIAQNLDLQLKYEKEAANVLNNLLKQKKKNLLSEKKLDQLISNKEVVVFGAGPSLEKTIIKYKKMIENKVKIAADGATTALLQKNILPDVIVTDLDGEIIDQLQASSLGCITVIHTHGDNINKIKKYVSEFKGKIFGTTQINPQPYSHLYNYGGFTDGGRAVFLSDQFHAKKIYLAGFDFDEKIGKYSFAANKNKKLKLKKLKWCKYLLEILGEKNHKIHYLRL